MYGVLEVWRCAAGVGTSRRRSMEVWRCAAGTVPEVIRCVLLCMLELVEGGLYLLDVLEAMQRAGGDGGVLEVMATC